MLTPIDRLVGWLDPRAGLRRAQARAAFSALSSYEGARRDKPSMLTWNPYASSADAATLYDLPTLRARARDLARNNPIATGAVDTQLDHVVGWGLEARARIDREVLELDDEAADAWERAADREWRLHADSTDIDATGQATFGELQGLAFRSALEGGDVFALRTWSDRPGSLYAQRWQLVEAERACNPNNQADTPALAGGIETDGTAPTKIHFRSRHPSDLANATDSWRSIPVAGDYGLRNVLHVVPRTRPDQRRGVPFVAPIIESLRQLDNYTRAELMAAVVNSCFALTSVGLDDDDAGDDVAGGAAAAGSERRLRISEPGSINELEPGQEVKGFTPGRPNAAFDPFVKAITELMGVGLNIPAEVLMRRFSASYSASRAALEMLWMATRTRRVWLVRSFCRPVRDAVITEAVLRGRLQAPGFFSDPVRRAAWLGADWVGAPAPQLDEEKTVRAALLRIQGTLSTRDREAAILGQDWESNVRQAARENRLLQSAGMATPAAPEPTEPAEPATPATAPVDPPQE